jgi:GNAT superfamily N-acetyltransferase
VTIEIRAVSGYADLERWVATRNEVLPDDPDTVEMMALVRASELDHVDLLACDGEEILGTGMLAGDPESVASGYTYVEVTVPERHRGRGVGAALLKELSERARRLGREGLEAESRANDPYSIAFLEHRGFAETGRAAKYVLDLAAYEEQETPAVEGLELVMLADRPEFVQGMYEVARAAYPDMGGYQARQAQTLQDWQVYHLGSPGTALDMTPVAIADGEVIGFATMIRRADGRTAEHRIAAVRADWRGRGVARWLLLAQLDAAKRSGVETVVAWGRDGRTGRTYGADLGFEEQAETIAFRGPLQ